MFSLLRKVAGVPQGIRRPLALSDIDEIKDGKFDHYSEPDCGGVRWSDSYDDVLEILVAE